MNSILRKHSVSRISLILCALTSCTIMPFSAQAFEAGAAKVEITPPIGTPLNGYGDRMGRGATHVHDPLWARAVYLDDGETQVVLVNTDLCLINPELRDAVLAKAPTEIPAQNIILTATHTHNGPGATVRNLPTRFVAGQFMPSVLESLSDNIVKAIVEARNKRVRAAIGYGTATQTVLSTNRRDKGGPIDEQIGVIRVDDADGNALAIIANFAAHPTSVVKEDHYAFSADYPGFYYSEIEKLSSDGCVALFLNGAEGNQTTGNPEDKAGWERTESVGRLLAVRVKAVANKIECSEASLTINTSEPTLPMTLSKSFQPGHTVLQSLEIDDLILHFWPGEPVVELGLALRQKALAAGYAAQFSVGLANDYLMYFIPRDMYHLFHYEASQNYYGPGIQDWFMDEFSHLSARMEATERPDLMNMVEPEQDGPLLVLKGDAYTRGLQQGATYQESIVAAYTHRIEDELHSGALLPTTGLWTSLPRFIDPTALALPMMAMAARPLLSDVSKEAVLEMEGMAEAVGLPFDAIWLLQSAPYLPGIMDKSPLFKTPLCTMFAVTGERAGADDLLVGRNLDWAVEEEPTVLKVYPETGHAYIQVGFTWNSGVFTGMNDQGLVLTLQRLPDFMPSNLDATPLEFVLKTVLQEAGTVDEALVSLKTQKVDGTASVLIAGRTEDGESSAFVIEYGDTTTIRSGEEGLLLGFLPEIDKTPKDASVRYGRVRSLLAEERIIGKEEIAKVLVDTDSDSGKTGMQRIYNENTQHAVVFSPLKRKVDVAFPDGSGSTGAYSTYTLEVAP